VHRILRQGEDRDSSDEEWEAAYNALDPIAQLGWRNRWAEVNAVGGDLVRDVFVAADEMHENAMSQMEGNTLMVEGTQGEGADVGEAPILSGMERSMDADNNVNFDTEGEAPS
jgi:hypothetical protein